MDDANPQRATTLHRRIWTARELSELLRRYEAEGPSQLGSDLGRSDDSVSSQARRFGLRTQRRPYRRNRTSALGQEAGTSRQQTRGDERQLQ